MIKINNSLTRKIRNVLIGAISLPFFFGSNACVNTGRYESRFIKNSYYNRNYQEEVRGHVIKKDYDANPDLDIIIETKEERGRRRVAVHEEAWRGNYKNLEEIRRLINTGDFEVEVFGDYTALPWSREVEGIIDPEMISFVDINGHYATIFTDNDKFCPRSSRINTGIYLGWGGQNWFWADSDWDGIPNGFDPWPYYYSSSWRWNRPHNHWGWHIRYNSNFITESKTKKDFKKRDFQKRYNTERKVIKRDSRKKITTQRKHSRPIIKDRKRLENRIRMERDILPNNRYEKSTTSDDTRKRYIAPKNYNSTYNSSRRSQSQKDTSKKSTTKDDSSSKKRTVTKRNNR